MYSGYIDIDEIKRKIRKLKKLEMKIRFGNAVFFDGKQGFKKDHCADLVWDEFFDLHPQCNKKVRFSLRSLTSMNKEELKSVIREFFFSVYYRYYKENGIVNVHLYDPQLLAQMGLPYDADNDLIKKKFRELAKKYHPDTGGDSIKFIELMENYKKLVE